MLLSDPNIEPTENVLSLALQDCAKVYFSLQNNLKENFGLEYQWRYYKDGKSWLCKVEKKKKTIFWLSVWEGSFNITFYFTEKTKPGIYDLTINQIIKDKFSEAKPVGKLIPLTMEIKNEGLIPDLIEIIAYKMNVG